MRKIKEFNSTLLDKCCWRLKGQHVGYGKGC